MNKKKSLYELVNKVRSIKHFDYSGRVEKL